MKRNEVIERLENILSDKRKEHINRILVGDHIFLLLFHKSGYFGQYNGIPVLRSRKLSDEGILIEMKKDARNNKKKTD